MKKEFHILNGDALLQEFPKEILGEKIVMRECLIEGDLSGESLDVFFRNRARYIQQTYPAYLEEDYVEKTESELKKLLGIPNNSEINLWFEDDLFCQANLWFVLKILKDQEKNYSIHLLRPLDNNPYGFGRIDKAGLINLYQNRRGLNNLDLLAKLWGHYKKGNDEELIKLAEDLQTIYPFILEAVNAYVESKPKASYLGRPKETLKQLLQEGWGSDFGKLFEEFSKRESIYGYGDMQVKRMLLELNKKSINTV